MTLDQVPPMVDYSMVNRTYRYSTQMPLYSFGYGLSYSDFLYDKLYLSVTEVTGDTEVVEVNVQVKNVGSIDAEEVGHQLDLLILQIYDMILYDIQCMILHFEKFLD